MQIIGFFYATQTELDIKTLSFEDEIIFISTRNPYVLLVKSLLFARETLFSSVFAEDDSLKFTIIGILVKIFSKILECLKKDVILQNNLQQTI